MHKYPVLVSYAYLRSMKEETVHDMLSHPRVEWLIDSGAFTALNAGHVINLNDYCAWLHRWKPFLHGYLALDVLGDPKATDRNLHIMRAEGLTPLPVHVWGDDERRMDQLFEWSDWVALGGLRRPHRLHCPKSYVKIKMQWAKGRRVHWLGYTHAGMVRTFKPYSCDSSNAAAGFMWGRANFYHGDAVTWSQLDAREVKDVRQLKLTVPQLKILQAMDIHPTMLCNKARRRGSPGTNLFGEITLNSFLRYALDMLDVIGSRVYIASSPVHWKAVKRHVQLIDKQRHEQAV